MFRYFSILYDNLRRVAYNSYHGSGETEKKYPTLESDIDLPENTNIDHKQLKIDILLFVKQIKNTYFRYTCKDKFSPELYNSFVDEDHFDGGTTAFDDDDDTRIFDKYVLEYIKHRNDVMTYLQCKNKIITVKQRLEDLDEVVVGNENLQVVFAIDMSDKDLFNYCYSLIAKHGNLSFVKNIVFSVILKYEGQYVRMKLGAYNKNSNAHPYLILERFM